MCSYSIAQTGILREFEKSLPYSSALDAKFCMGSQLEKGYPVS